MTEPTRCPWGITHPLYVAYHDEEWGVPEHDDRKLLEMLLFNRELDRNAMPSRSPVASSYITSGFGGRLTRGAKTGRKVSPDWNTLVGQRLDLMDKMNSSLDGCVRVKIYKA